MNYQKIGKKIKEFRKSKGLSQEELAEKIDISVTHMSHIETGSTKLSLSVFANIVSALGVSADTLLSDNIEIEKDEETLSKVNSLLKTCTVKQIKIIGDVLKATKLALDTYD